MIVSYVSLCILSMRVSRGDGGQGSAPSHRGKSRKYIEFLNSTGPDPLKKRISTKSAFNVGALSAYQRNAI